MHAFRTFLPEIAHVAAWFVCVSWSTCSLYCTGS